MKGKITFCIGLLLFTVFISNAQVKVGNNPNSIDPNSLLELESTNKGFLTPRVVLNDINSPAPLAAPVPVGMLVYSTGGTLKDGFYYWNGTSWGMINTSVSGRTNHVLVKSAADFPAPVAGVITLQANTVYEVNGTILLSNKINLNNSWIKGIDAVNDKLVYIASSGELFTGSNGGNIRNITLCASAVGAKVFNLDGGGINKNLVLMNCYIVGSDNIGVIKEYTGTVYFQTVAFFVNNNGITLQNISNVIMSNTLWDASNKNIFEKYVGSFNIIQKIGGDMITSSANSATAIDVTGITSIQAGELKVVLFSGTGAYVTGTFSKEWEVESAGLTSEKDEAASGNIYITTNAPTSFASANTPTKVLGTTNSASLFRVSSPTDNRLTYTGTKTRKFQVICSLTLTSAGNNKYYSFYIVKNGVPLQESRQTMKLASGADQGSMTLSCTVELGTNDYIEVWVENNTDVTSTTIHSLNLAIK